MSTKIFVNLPVKDLGKSVDFFTKLGFSFDPQFTADNATCMVISDDIYAMLLVEPFFKSFTNKEIVDATKSMEAILALGVDSRQRVGKLVDKASRPAVRLGASRATRTSCTDGASRMSTGTSGKCCTWIRQRCRRKTDSVVIPSAQRCSPRRGSPVPVQRRRRGARVEVAQSAGRLRVRVAGCMASQPGSEMPDVWSVYLATGDARKTADAAVANDGQVCLPAVDVADLSAMAVVSDPGGANIGVWQPGLHHGFGVLDESGAPSWFELHTRDYQAAVGFYREVFGWEIHVVSDTPEFRHTTLKHGESWLAGIMDASGFLPDGPRTGRCTSGSTTPTPHWQGSWTSVARS